jgi:Male sterility protein
MLVVLERVDVNQHQIYILQELIFESFRTVLDARNSFTLAYLQHHPSLSPPGEFFAMHEWNFDNTNLRQLIADVNSADDGAEFACDMSAMNWDAYVEKYMLGIRKFVLKDGLESMTKARKKIVQLYWTKRAIQVVVLLLLHYLFFKICFNF